jgi:hypothetical protein
VDVLELDSVADASWLSIAVDDSAFFATRQQSWHLNM